MWPLDEGFDRLAGPIAQVVGRLTADGAWELHLTADPAAAIRLLAASVSQLKSTATR
jgi:hypothetical protein